MGHLKVLLLNGTAVKELPSSIECLFGLIRIGLKNCKRLVSLPPSVSKLKPQYELDLTGCYEFEDFPEILEPMGHLKILFLNGTAVKELPSSIECLFGLVSIGLKNCKRLVSLPPSILKLKSLYELDLTGLSEFEDFPEIWEPMGHLKVLLLNGTAVKELPSSIECLFGLIRIGLKICKRLASLPPSILKLKSLYELDLTGCSEFEDFPEIWEPMGDLTVLLLNGTAVKELPSSIECLFGLLRIGLKNCKRLVSLQPSICKLKSLKELDLTDCSEFEDFPEIWEPMGHLKVLLLNGTAVKELPSSIKCPFGLLRIGLKNCKRLVSLPPSICKLKSLKELDLTGCSEFEDLPEILEPMGELEFLGLERTSVKGLPSSIGNLTGLQKLDLCFCKNLEFVPESFYNLNRLIILMFDGCLKLKKLPPFSVGLHSLEVLNLSYCSTLEIPDHLLCLTSLRKLDLSGTMIKSIPVNIKQASSLLFLCLINCKSLQSLPELPLTLCSLKAHGCTSLNAVSSSRTALAQGWDGYNFFPGLNQELIFSNCLKLDQNAWKHVMADAQPKIIQFALAVSKPEEEEKQIEVASNVELEKEIEDASDVELEEEIEDSSDVELEEEIEDALDVELEEEIEVASDVELEEIIEIASDNYYPGRPSFIIVCPGHEIPNWFSYQNEGSTINIKFPPDWVDTDFLGFALSVVVGFDNYNVKGSLGFGCKSKFKANNGKSCEYNCRLLVLYCHETNNGENND